MKRMTKLLSLMLAALMLVGILPLGVWAAGETHTVRFNLNYNGAPKLSDQQVADGEYATQPEGVIREGWHFAYWYVKRGNNQIEKFDLAATPITKDVTLYARWTEDTLARAEKMAQGLELAKRMEEKEETYTVTFEANGEDVVNLPAAQRVKKGEKAIEPAAPLRAGFTFEGWYTDAELTERYDFSAQVTGSITLYAKWTPDRPEGTFVVSFETNGGSEIPNQIIYSGFTAYCPAAPVKENFVFENWYSDSALTTLYDFSTPVTSDITLYAKYYPLNVVITINSGDYPDNVVNRTITGSVTANDAIIGVSYTMVSENTSAEDTLTLDSANNFSIDVLLSDGENTFTVIVTTADGSQTQKSVTLKFDSGYVYDDDDVYDENDGRLIKIPIWYGDDTSGDPDEYLVSNILSLYFYDTVTFEERKTFITDTIGGEVVGYLNSLDMMQVLLPNPLTNATEVGYEGETDLTKITEDGLYEYADALVLTYEYALDSADLEYIHLGKSLAVTTDDPWNNAVDDDWWLEKIEAYDSWEYDNYYHSDFLTNVRIGVVDGGFRTSHDELRDRITVISDSNHNDDHGTHVAGIIAAEANNTTGIAGVLYNNIDDLLVYDADSNLKEAFSDSQLSKGLVRSVENKAKVINFSIGSSGSIRADNYEVSRDSINREGKKYSKYIEKLLHKGCDFIVVQSAGNGNDDGVGVDYWNNGLFAAINSSNCYTRRFFSKVSKQNIMNHIIIVANINSSNMLNFSSNGGSGELNIIAAPGTHIYSCIDSADDAYGYKSGTSMAAPIVTAVCGLTWSVNPLLSGEQVVQMVMDNTVGTAATCDETYRMPVTTTGANGIRVPVRDDNGNIVYRTDSNGNQIFYRSHTSGDMGIVNALKSVEAAIDSLPTFWGTVVDAVTRAPLKAKIVIINSNGEIVGKDQAYYSLDNGVFVLPKLPAGKYTRLIIKDGYITVSEKFSVNYTNTLNEHINIGVIPLSKNIGNDTYRIVLHWTSEPRDLDSHLVATTSTGDKYHVWFGNITPSPAYANLDRDDTDYEGPETITITNIKSLRNVRYAIHDYTNRDKSFSTILSNSGARIVIYKGNSSTPIAQFNVPIGQHGTEWDVFAIDAVGNIIPINRMVYCNNPLNVLIDPSNGNDATNVMNVMNAPYPEKDY